MVKESLKDNFVPNKEIKKKFISVFLQRIFLFAKKWFIFTVKNVIVVTYFFTMAVRLNSTRIDYECFNTSVNPRAWALK